ncbi:MAG: hypothetical protein MI924_27430, partial [Chloroflexales bacterium]|nr:hypothetical protein [Chloroflexales bacterium]
MHMFCNQCQETTHNSGCIIRGICGKDPRTAALQDYLLYALKGFAFYGVQARAHGMADETTDLFVAQALFATLTNVNFDPERIYQLTREAFARRDHFRTQLTAYRAGDEAPSMAICSAEGDIEDYVQRDNPVDCAGSYKVEG